MVDRGGASFAFERCMSDSHQTDVIVLGGGLAGLYAATILARQGQRVTVLEPDDSPNGTWLPAVLNDLTVHPDLFLLDDRDPALLDDLTSLSTYPLLPIPPFDPHLHWGQNFHPLPLTPHTFLAGFPLARRPMAWTSLSTARRLSREAPTKEETAEAALSRQFGGIAARDYFEPLLHRWFGRTSASLAANAIDGLPHPLREFAPHSESQNSISRQLFTTQRGAAPLLEGLVATLQAHGGKLVCGAEITRFKVEDQRVTGVRVRDAFSPEEEAEHSFEARDFLWTLPLRPLVKALGQAAPAQIHASSLYLTHRPRELVLCLVNRPSCLPHPDIYFLDRPYVRLLEPSMAGIPAPDENRTLLTVEWPAVEADGPPVPTADRWAQSLAALQSDGWLRESEIEAYRALKHPAGPPLLRLEYDAHLQRLQTYLTRLENLRMAGSQATFSLLGSTAELASGAAAARAVTEA